jgi:hypothetical protein
VLLMVSKPALALVDITDLRYSWGYSGQVEPARCERPGVFASERSSYMGSEGQCPMP